jgi:hypothetical protein
MPPAGEPRSGCPINATIEVIGDRWSLLVLRDVMFGNRRHFRELQKRSEEGIASNILADRLRRLVAGGLLTREGVDQRRVPVLKVPPEVLQEDNRHLAGAKITVGEGRPVRRLDPPVLGPQIARRRVVGAHWFSFRSA